jgi:hypothetical protein
MSGRKQIISEIIFNIRQARSLLSKMENMTKGDDRHVMSALLFTRALVKSINEGDLSPKSIGSELEKHINNINNQQELGDDTDK